MFINILILRLLFDLTTLIVALIAMFVEFLGIIFYVEKLRNG